MSSGNLAVVGVDLGGTTTKAALVDQRGALRARATVTTGRGMAAVDAAVDIIAELRKRATDEGLDVEAAGVAVPGLVDRARGRVAFASNLDWRNLELAAVVGTRADIPVVVEHDVRAAGAAEGLMGAGAGLPDFVLLQIGTGISAAVYTDGRMVAGTTHGAGEVGHMPVELEGELCPCGKHGCLEAYASGASVVRRYRRAGGADVDGAEDVVTRIATDPVAARIWAEAVEALGAGCDILTNTLDPGAIVIGGGLARADDALFGPLRAAVSRRAVWRAPVDVRPSRLGDTGGIRGAAMAAFDLLNRADLPASWVV